ncbi:MAG TPA: cupin domain-containing protein [Methanosarcina sp.]|nr:cupin domain-containing protein [Methanosarcina sp.]
MIEQVTETPGRKPRYSTPLYLEGGSILPTHDHIHEQTGYLVSGKIIMTIGEETFEVESGDSWTIPGGVAHGVEILEDSIAIEVFSPRRDEYMKQ